MARRTWNNQYGVTEGSRAGALVARLLAMNSAQLVRLVVVVVMLCGVIAPSLAQTTIPLRWVVRNEEASWKEAEEREPVFRREPDYAGDAVTRGFILLGSEEDGNTRVAFAFDEKGKRVYVDMNRDLDLTNDPNGLVPVEKNRAWIDVPLTTASLAPSAHVEFWKRSSKHPLLTSVSGIFRGEFELDGRMWLVRLWRSGFITVTVPTSWKRVVRPPIHQDEHEWIYNGRSISLKAIPEADTTSVRLLSLTVRDIPRGSLFWPFLYRQMPLAGLLTLLLLRRANRRLGALAIGISLAVTVAVLWCIELLADYSREMDTYLSVARAVSIGFAAFWLMIGESSRTGRQLLAAVLAGLLCLGTLVVDGQLNDNALILSGVVFCGGISSCSLVAACLGPRFVCSRALLWMPLACIVLCLVFITGLCFGPIILIAVHFRVEALLSIFVMVGSLGVITYALLLPYLLLGILSPFYRNRLAEIVGGA